MFTWWSLKVARIFGLVWIRPLSISKIADLPVNSGFTGSLSMNGIGTLVTHCWKSVAATYAWCLCSSAMSMPIRNPSIFSFSMTLSLGCEETRFVTILGCSFPIGGYKLRRHLATWQNPERFGRALSLVPTNLSFCQCAYAFTTPQCLCYNCEKNPCLRSFLLFTDTWITPKVLVVAKSKKIRSERPRTLSPYELWFSVVVKEKMKDREFRTVQDILHRLMETWNDLTFKNVQSVFREWQIRLNGS
jgi:hypothetical protein